MLDYIVQLVLASAASRTDVARLAYRLRAVQNAMEIEGDEARPSAELLEVLRQVERGECRECQ